ncbi:alpha/beta hydrolase [Saccharopolyspora rhizosphaerae]|uniref:Alpha/beta hydrolase n=1 Tax=Saccharopolyspora rhizosphaerae TaxID=2492662 RepID=A0A426JUV5_9PSEU|nr:alpha/beta hydrolase [Saccharopolyspora rhizosphaerae]RRO16897.1 alpha/beta hydrolase [Saccharopolyspora rhizosphaerae]
MPLHPEAQNVLSTMSEAGLPPFEHLTVPQARAAGAGFVHLQGEPEEIATEDRAVPGPAGDVPVRFYTPEGDGPKAVIVYFHGGGWVIGDIDVCDNPVRRIANRTGAIVVSVDYRRAPEHVYPAAFDDCYAVTAWVAEHAAEFGGDPARLATCGDSAGGNLAAAVAIAARDRQSPNLVAQLLIYPVTDFHFTTDSYERNGEGYLLTKGSMQWFWAHYLGAQDLGKDPYACPARADDLTGLPPAFVATAEFDPLRDEGENYADALRAAGVQVTAKRYEGMLHGFAWTLGATPSGAVIIDDLASAFRSALDGVR